MGGSDGRERMLKRHEIVVRIIEANSRVLRIENEFNGLDIERRNAERAGSREAVAGIEARMKAIDEERVRLAAEKVWLDEALAAFDGAPSAETASRAGRA